MQLVLAKIPGSCFIEGTARCSADCCPSGTQQCCGEHSRHKDGANARYDDATDCSAQHDSSGDAYSSAHCTADLFSGTSVISLNFGNALFYFFIRSARGQQDETLIG